MLDKTKKVRLTLIPAVGEPEHMVTEAGSLGRVLQDLTGAERPEYIDFNDGHVLWFNQMTQAGKIALYNKFASTMIEVKAGITRRIVGDVVLTYAEDFLDEV